MPHAIWKGSISFGLVQIPVNLYPGEKRDELSFAMLDKRDLSPVGYKRVNKNTGKEVPWEEVVKGYEYEEGKYVVLSDEDFKAANPKATQTVDIVDVVYENDIPKEYFDRPYILAPTARGAKGYALLRETLKHTGKVGIANVVIHTRQYLSAVIPHGNMLVLNLLRYPDEIRDTSEFEVPGEDLSALGVTDKEVQMAKRLVEGMVDRWEPSRYRDTYRQDIMALIDKKIKEGKTKEVHAPPPEEGRKPAEIIDLMALLKKSVEQKGGKKTAAVQPGQKRAARK